MNSDRRPGRAPFADMVWVPGGTFTMGSDRHYPEEAPAHAVYVDGFWMDRWTVTNAQFRRFVADTGYRTAAERVPTLAEYPGARPEMLVAGSVVFDPPSHRVDLRNHFNWWTYVAGANWRHPQGPRSSTKHLDRVPVVQVAFEDVQAYAAWAGKALPTEAEWEFAARGGLPDAEYVWGADFAPGGRQMANTWQGEFPLQNLKLDGYAGLAPVGSFPPNGYGLYDMAGNVWEWTTDWYQDHTQLTESCCTLENPLGATLEASIAHGPAIRQARKVIKGGSYLCAPNYCRRYRPAARTAQEANSATCHIGFRCIVRR